MTQLEEIMLADDLTSEERKVLTKFRATPTDERNLIVRVQDKGNNFVFLDNEADAHKVSEQMSKGFISDFRP